MDRAERDRVRSELEISAFEADDAQGIAELIEDMSESVSDATDIRDGSARYYEWMYLDNPAGRAIVHVARHRGRIVGNFAIAPKNFVVGEESIRIGKTMDMFTHPDYQGLGLMGLLAKGVIEAARGAGIDTWYVTPSRNSYPIFLNKWGYRESHQLHFACRVLKPSGLLAASERTKGLAGLLGPPLDAAWALGRIGLRRGRDGYSFTESTRFEEDADALWQQADTSGVCLIRDARYLNWRYVEGPDRYEILRCDQGSDLVGFIVLKCTVRRGQPCGDIVDLLHRRGDRETPRVMLRRAVERFAELGCVMVQAWSLAETPLAEALHSAGLRWLRTEVPILFNPDSPHEMIYRPDRWTLTLGDGNDI